MRFTLLTDGAGNRGLYDDGKMVATWDRRDRTDLKHIERQIAQRAGTLEVEYATDTVDELPEELQEPAEGKETANGKAVKKSPVAKSARGKPRSAPASPGENSPARESDPSPINPAA